MKFLKLLDPNDLATNDISAPGKQQQKAAERFPQLVELSRLHYWHVGDPIPIFGARYLVGLAASYDLRDLRLADIMNDRLATLQRDDVRVDVFNAAEHPSMNFSEYFSILPPIPEGWHFTPLIGKWMDGNQVHAISGYEGRKYILEELDCGITVEDSVTRLSPPDPRLMED